MQENETTRICEYKEAVKKLKDKYHGRLVLVKVGIFKKGKWTKRGKLLPGEIVNLEGKLASIVSIEFSKAKNKYFDLNTDELVTVKILYKNKYFILQNHMVGSIFFKGKELGEEIEASLEKAFDAIDVDLIIKHEELQPVTTDATDCWIENQVFPKGIENYIVKTKKDFGLAPSNVVRALEHERSFPIEINKNVIVYPLAIKRCSGIRRLKFLFYCSGNVYKYEFSSLENISKDPLSPDTILLDKSFKINEYKHMSW